MSDPICTATLEARRERAVQRAITRACQQLSDVRMRMVEILQGAPTEYYEVPPDAVWSAPQGYTIDGVHAHGRDEAVGLLRDRYGLTEPEAARALYGARRV